jgi:hypothetical protein
MSGRFALILASLAALALTSACVVRHHPPPAYRSSPPPPHHRDCRPVCDQWGHERRCHRRCSLYSNGVCVRWTQHCDHRRFCRRHVTRCY